MSQAKKKILFVHYGESAVRGSEVCLVNLIGNIDREQFKPIVWCNSLELACQLKRFEIEVILEFKGIGLSSSFRERHRKQYITQSYAAILVEIKDF